MIIEYNLLLDGFEFGMSQIYSEINDLVYFLNGRNIKSFMEIGIDRGGTFKNKILNINEFK